MGINYNSKTCLGGKLAFTSFIMYFCFFFSQTVDYSYSNANISNATVHYTNPRGLVEERRDDYAALFLITFVTVVPLILALFAISWAMWNIDPGRDSIIYRNTDNIPGMN